MLGIGVIFLCLSAYGCYHFYENDFAVRQVMYVYGIAFVAPLSALWTLAVCVLFCALGVTRWLNLILNQKPRLIVGSQGIDCAGYGLIPWARIKEIKTVVVTGQTFIGIVLKDSSPFVGYAERWSWPRRMIIAANMPFGAHIFLDKHLTVPQAEVLSTIRTFPRRPRANT